MGLVILFIKKHTEKLDHLTSADFFKLGNHEFDVSRELLDGDHYVLTPYDPRPNQSIASEKYDTSFIIKKNIRM
jgi:hypothetical protein